MGDATPFTTKQDKPATNSNRGNELTFTTNPPINLINDSTTNPNSNMVIHNLRNSIPTHRSNRSGKSHNITRRRIATLRDIPV
jgi:hypothetical protein